MATSIASRFAAFVRQANTTAVAVPVATGNTTVNSVVNATSIVVASATSNIQLTATGLTVGSAVVNSSVISSPTVFVGNSSINTNITANTIVWNTTGVGAPTAITRSAGTRLVLSPAVAVDKVDYAIGIDTGILWNSVSSTAQGFKWYANTFTVMTANVAGVTLPNALTVGNSTVYSQFTQVSTVLQANATNVGMVIASNGNVGVGTAIPGSKLVVNGAMTATDVTVSGNLTVSGTTTYINTTNLNVGDNIVSLNADVTNVTAPSENAGISVNRGSSANVAILWDESIDKWTLTNDGVTYANIAVGAVGGGGSLPTTIAAQNTTGTASAAGANAFAVGAGANAYGSGSIVIGIGANSYGASSIAIGISANAPGPYGVAIGYAAAINAANGIAIGVGSSALLTNAVAVGANSRTYGYDTVALGAGSFANGNYSISIGSVSRANNYSIAVGQGADAADQGIAMGVYANAYGGRGVAIGHSAFAYGSYSVALGPSATTYNSYDVMLGTSSHTVTVPGAFVPTGIVANASYGTSGQVLKTSGVGGAVYWGDAGGFTNGSSISVGDLIVGGGISANGSLGNAGEILYSTGTGVYWGAAPTGGTTNSAPTPVSYNAGSSTFIPGDGYTYITSMNGPTILRIYASMGANSMFLSAVNALSPMSPSTSTFTITDSFNGPATITIQSTASGPYGSQLAAGQWVQFQIASVPGPMTWNNIMEMTLLTTMSSGGGGSAPVAGPNTYFKYVNAGSGSRSSFDAPLPASANAASKGLLVNSRGQGFGSPRYITDIRGTQSMYSLQDLSYQVYNWYNNNHTNVIYLRPVVSAQHPTNGDTSITISYDGQYYFDFAYANMWVLESSSVTQSCYSFIDQINTQYQTSYMIQPWPIQNSGQMTNTQGWVYGMISGYPPTLQQWMASVQITQPQQGHIWHDTTNGIVYFRMPWSAMGGPTVIQGATSVPYDYLSVSLFYFGN